MSDLQQTSDTTPTTTQQAAEGAAERARREGLSQRTIQTYEDCFERFRAWCEERGYEARPAAPEVVATYLEYRRQQHELTAPSLQQYASAIGWAHRQRQLENPAQADVVTSPLKDMRSEDQGRTKNKARPLRPAQLKRVVRQCGRGPRGLRDRAVLLVGFVGALRRSELAALQLGDVERRPGGYVLTLRTQKNREEPQKKGIPRTGNDPSAYEALSEWLELLDERGIERGALFRSVGQSGGLGESISPDGVAYLFKQRLEAAGLSTSDFSTHSLRAGFLTTASEEGAGLADIQRQSGHKDSDSALGYIRDGRVLQNPAVEAVGL